MFAIIPWIRAALVALVLGLSVAPALATGRAPQSSAPSQRRTTEAVRSQSQTAATAEEVPAGSPEFGILLIIGVVGFLVFVAWLLTRVGDDTPSSDGSII